MLAKTDEVTYPTYRYARMGLGLKVAMALPSDGVAYNISRNNEYIQKISNRNGSIAHIAGNTYAHPFSTQQAIGTIHIDVYIYKLYTHLPRFTGLSQRPCTTSAVRTRYNAEVAEGSFTMTPIQGFQDQVTPQSPLLRCITLAWHTWVENKVAVVCRDANRWT